VPDWKPEIRQRLAGLKLEPTREAAIVEELAQFALDFGRELAKVGWIESLTTNIKNSVPSGCVAHTDTFEIIEIMSSLL